MQAYQLKNRLNNLLLVGQEDGELQFLGRKEDWKKVELLDKKFGNEGN